MPFIDEPGTAYMVAHACREISNGVIRRLAADRPGPTDGRRAAINKSDENDEEEREKLRHRIARALDRPAEDKYVGHWFSLGRGAAAAAHYRAERPPQPANVKQVIEGLEDKFIDSLIPYFSAAKELDELLNKKTPTPEDIERVQRIVQPSQRRYFFNRLDHAGWAEPMVNAGIFINIPGPEVDEQTGKPVARPWPEGDYLVRVAELAPEIVADVLTSVSDDNNNLMVWNILVSATLLLPPERAGALVPKICAGLKGPFGPLIADKTTQLAMKLAGKGDAGSFELASHLLFVRLPPTEPEEIKRMQHEYGSKWTMPRLHWIEFEVIFKEMIPALIKLDPQTTLDLLIKKIFRIHDLTNNLAPGLWGDLWSLKRAAVDAGEYPSRDLLAAALEASADIVKRNPEEAARVWKFLNRFEGEAFKRLQLGFLAIAGGDLLDELHNVFHSPEVLEPGEYGREIAALVRGQLQNLDTQSRNTFIEGLLRGPTFEADEKLKEAWQKERLFWFREQIPDELCGLAESLGVMGHIPTLMQQELAEVGYFVGGEVSWEMDPSPVTANELGMWETSNIIEYLNTWEPTPEPLKTGSRSGLSGRLRGFAKNHPQKAIKVLRGVRLSSYSMDYCVSLTVERYRGCCQRRSSCFME